MEEILELARKYIKLPANKRMNEEEQYYNPRTKEYFAFIEGYKEAQKKLFSLDQVSKLYNEYDLYLDGIAKQNRDVFLGRSTKPEFLSFDKWLKHKFNIHDNIHYTDYKLKQEDFDKYGNLIS